MAIKQGLLEQSSALALGDTRPIWRAPSRQASPSSAASHWPHAYLHLWFHARIRCRAWN